MKRVTFGQQMAREDGIKEGREEGREEGEKKGREAVALQMLAEDMDIVTICKCTGLTEKQVKALIPQKAA